MAVGEGLVQYWETWIVWVEYRLKTWPGCPVTGMVLMPNEWCAVEVVS